ncbi:hypothetical protein GM182_05570 [bacterium 3DAC]|jgi:cytoskeletal protein CcmA (bactofilin family)|nr:polymer-forming cytoskeletal protein [Dictyoglomota bacterium]UZN23339.1 hypothetical protein GM182_05570 [bacterium 3DAC]
MFGRRRRVSSDIGLYVGAHTTVEGKVFSTKGTINIAGSFNGDIVSQDLVIITEEGKVQGTIKAKELHVFGKVNGIVEVENELIIGMNGLVEGEASYGSLHVEEGGQIKGKMAPRSKESSTEKSAKQPKKGNKDNKNKK